MTMIGGEKGVGQENAGGHLSSPAGETQAGANAREAAALRELLLLLMMVVLFWRREQDAALGSIWAQGSQRESVQQGWPCQCRGLGALESQ
jgi:hypothetical protein